MSHPFFQGTRAPRVFAHRGLTDATASTVPVGIWENTAAAFAQAHAAGVEYLETDCRVTADGDVVLFHDPDLVRLFGQERRLSAVRTADLATLLAPYGGLLTVAEALEAFPESRFNIDVKEEAAVVPLAQAIAAHTRRVLVTSFSDARRRRTVAAARSAGARLRPATSGGRGTVAALAALASVGLDPSPALRDIDAVQLPRNVGPIPVFTPALVRAAHRRGVEVHVWTINEPADMRRLVAAGADGIVTDRADAALRALH